MSPFEARLLCAVLGLAMHGGAGVIRLALEAPWRGSI